MNNDDYRFIRQVMAEQMNTTALCTAFSFELETRLIEKVKFKFADWENNTVQYAYCLSADGSEVVSRRPIGTKDWHRALRLQQHEFYMDEAQKGW